MSPGPQNPARSRAPLKRLRAASWSFDQQPPLLKPSITPARSFELWESQNDIGWRMVSNISF
jgi:hypothetical protein